MMFPSFVEGSSRGAGEVHGAELVRARACKVLAQSPPGARVREAMAQSPPGARAREFDGAKPSVGPVPGISMAQS